MIQENAEMEFSIANAKVMAREKQPIRHDVYLQHLSYYEDCIKTLKNIIDRMSEQNNNAPSQISYYFSVEPVRKKQKA